MKLILFDIDGTLISAGSASRRAFENAFEDLFQVKNALNGIKHHGLTDPLILRMVSQSTLLRRLNRTEESAFSARYLAVLPREITKDDSYVILPGVTQLCEILSKRSDVAIGLQTGNLRDAAPVKLGRGGLDGYFEFGGFGSDSVDRAAVVRIAIERAIARFPKTDFSPENTVVVGDTPNDIQAGRKNNVQTLAVATGHFSRAELSAENPSHVFDDLSDVQQFLRIAGLV